MVQPKLSNTRRAVDSLVWNRTDSLQSVAARARSYRARPDFRLQRSRTVASDGRSQGTTLSMKTLILLSRSRRISRTAIASSARARQFVGAGANCLQSEPLCPRPLRHSADTSFQTRSVELWGPRVSGDTGFSAHLDVSGIGRPSHGRPLPFPALAEGGRKGEVRRSEANTLAAPRSNGSPSWNFDAGRSSDRHLLCPSSGGLMRQRELRHDVELLDTNNLSQNAANKCWPTYVRSELSDRECRSVGEATTCERGMDQR